MGNNVLYVPQIDHLVINEAALTEILGELPPKPDVREMPAVEAEKMGVLTTKGVPYETRYDLKLGEMTYQPYERARLMVGLRRDPESGKYVATYDYVQMQSGRIKKNGESVQNPVVVPLEYKDGTWWMHGMLQYRLRMGWTLNCVGGYTPRGKNIYDAANQEIEEEFGVAKVITKALYTKEKGYEFFQDRATYRNGVALGFFVFEGPSWEVSSDPGGFEIVNKQRLAFPVQEYTTCPDLIAHGAFSLTEKAWRKGMLTPFEN